MLHMIIGGWEDKMDEETAREIADHCLEPVAHELEIHKCQQVADRIKTQLIIAHRAGGVKDWAQEIEGEAVLAFEKNDTEENA